ncbi:hypothetical protein GCM10011506_10750 [Marivirga lumbricoides]|uniref:DUF4249 domain-containing protein n=1 Tax=Marivirga lumbricoides TaxID=1046115 RepID=A0ABQ1LSZ0_9BACT|nr:hypothetical protein GCM10011506_10750 [Marivirga lumbricoides]
MTQLRNILVFACFIGCSLACQELIELDLAQSESRVVVEGIFTDADGPHRIKISKTINYYDTGKTPPVTDAAVQLLDSAENLLSTFTYNAEDSTYLSPEGLKGEVSKTYIVQIEVDGDIYRAKGTILRNATLDSLYYLSEKQLEMLGQPVFGEGYFLFANGNLNRPGVQYFKLQLKVNDTLKNSRSDLANSILSSEFFGSEFRGLPIPGSYKKDDTVSLRLFSLDEAVYDYYTEFINLLFNDGGVFSPPPVNATSNISNITTPENFPLGYIQFSSVLEQEVIIKDDEK